MPRRRSLRVQATRWFINCQQLDQKPERADMDFLCQPEGLFARKICFLGAEDVLVIIQAHGLMKRDFAALPPRSFRHSDPLIRLMFPTRAIMTQSLRVIKQTMDHWCHFGPIDVLAGRRERLDSANPSLNDLLLLVRIMNFQLVLQHNKVLSFLILLL